MNENFKRAAAHHSASVTQWHSVAAELAATELKVRELRVKEAAAKAEMIRAAIAVGGSLPNITE